MRDYIGDCYSAIGPINGDTRSLDYGSCGVFRSQVQELRLILIACFSNSDPRKNMNCFSFGWGGGWGRGRAFKGFM